jgi:hypothetical protein
MFTSMSVFKKYLFNLTKLNVKRFSTFYSQEELYVLNEHDRIILQLESNTATDIPKSMKDLLNLCLQVAHLKFYVKGWGLLSEYFTTNCKSLSNKDFFEFVKALGLSSFADDKLWERASESFLERQFEEAEFFELLNYITPYVNNTQFFEAVIEKYQKLDKSPKRAINMITSLGFHKYEPNPKTWDIILQDLKKIDLTKISEDELDTYLYAAGSIKDLNKENDTSFDRDVYNYFIANMEKCGTATVAFCIYYLDRLSYTTIDDLTRLCILVSKGYRDLTQSSKIEFFTKLLIILSHRTDLLKSLKANSQLLAFPIPNEDMIKGYQLVVDEFDKPNNIMESKKASDSFFDKYSQEMGFNPQFAKNYSMNIAYGIDELNKDFKH